MMKCRWSVGNSERFAVKRRMDTPDVNIDLHSAAKNDHAIDGKSKISRTHELGTCTVAPVVGDTERVYGNGCESHVVVDSLRRDDDVGLQEGRRKLILHFDIRNTILVADSVTKVNMEQSLNTFLTGVTWGKVDAGGEWAWLSDKPSLGPPCPGAITYYKHLERTLDLSPGDVYRARLRQATGDFTQKDIGRTFRPYFDKHLELLRWNYESSDSKLTMAGPGDRRYHYLLPSFVRLIHHLQEEARDFAIVLRTYGMDASNVLSCLKYIVTGHHPGFPNRLPIPVNTQPGHVRRSCPGKIRVTRFEKGSDQPILNGEDQGGDSEVVYDDELQVYQMLNNCRGISGFVDDFSHWQQNRYGYRDGKPFWIDLGDVQKQHVFFDDNIRVSADDSIVDLRLLRSDRQSFESVELDEMVDFEDACLVQSDLLRSISDVDYFVDKLRTCERNYSMLLRSTRRHQIGSSLSQ